MAAREPRSKRLGGRRRATGRFRDERGAALVEIAIVLPVLVTLLLGIISGGNAYQQKLSLTNGAREGARYGATLPVGSSLQSWLDDVSVVASKAVDDGLGVDVTSRVICVAYVHPAGTSAADQTARRRETSGGIIYSSGSCFSDGRPATERRVQVQLARAGELNAAFFKLDLNLTGKSVARFEDLGA
jgi:hypothetical protein